MMELPSFPDSSVGKESAQNAGDPSQGSERSAGEGIGYLLQYSWVSLVAQLVKNLPAMQETSVRSLGWEDPLENGKATHSSTLAWRTPRTVSFHGVAKSQTQLSHFHFHFPRNSQTSEGPGEHLPSENSSVNQRCLAQRKEDRMSALKELLLED